MFISKKHLSRRTVLRGLGVSLALPWLDSMVPALTALAKSGAAPARRFGVFYVPNGMAMDYWSPKTVGALGDLPATLQTLQPFKDRVLMLGRSGRCVGQQDQRRRRTLAVFRHIPHLRAVSNHHRRQRRRRNHHGSADRQGAVQADANCLTRARSRVGRHPRCVRRRKLLADQRHRLEQSDYTAADRERSALRVRAAVRTERQHRSGGESRPHPPQSQHARRRHRPDGPAQRAAGRRAIAPSSANMSTRFATSNDASKKPKSRVGANCRWSISRPAFPPTTPSMPR